MMTFTPEKISDWISGDTDDPGHQVFTDEDTMSLRHHVMIAKSTLMMKIMKINNNLSFLMKKQQICLANA